MIATLALLFGCRSSISLENPPGYLIVGIESNPLQLDPRYATDANSVRIDALVYNALLRADENLRLQPELAAHWQTVDNRTYLVELRRGITFHDGRPLTAQDVKYTFESVLKAENRSPRRAMLKPLEAVDQLDTYTLRFRLSTAHSPFP